MDLLLEEQRVDLQPEEEEEEEEERRRSWTPVSAERIGCPTTHCALVGATGQEPVQLTLKPFRMTCLDRLRSGRDRGSSCCTRFRPHRLGGTNRSTFEQMELGGLEPPTSWVRSARMPFRTSS